jgi:hypothetical protein
MCLSYLDKVRSLGTLQKVHSFKYRGALNRQVLYFHVWSVKGWPNKEAVEHPIAKTWKYVALFVELLVPSTDGTVLHQKRFISCQPVLLHSNDRLFLSK